MDRLSVPTFSQVIDTDHKKINVLAAKLRRATDQETLVGVRNEIIWRLMRHDYSENMIMRPAFARYMGAEGEAFARHDRGDHGNAKKVLLPMLDSKVVNADQKQVLVTLFDELREHMREESGVQIPKLEKVLSRETSQDLGRRYMQTQKLWPGAKDTRGNVIFKGGVKEYCGMSDGMFTRLVGQMHPEEERDSEAAVEKLRKMKLHLENI